MFNNEPNFKDYYKLFGVDSNATKKEIKNIYHNLANKYHPDKNPNNKEAEEKFKELGNAWEVLSDKEKRKRYDELYNEIINNSFKNEFLNRYGKQKKTTEKDRKKSKNEKKLEGLADYLRGEFTQNPQVVDNKYKPGMKNEKVLKLQVERMRKGRAYMANRSYEYDESGNIISKKRGYGLAEDLLPWMYDTKLIGREKALNIIFKNFKENKDLDLETLIEDTKAISTLGTTIQANATHDEIRNAMKESMKESLNEIIKTSIKGEKGMKKAYKKLEEYKYQINEVQKYIEAYNKPETNKQKAIDLKEIGAYLQTEDIKEVSKDIYKMFEKEYKNAIRDNNIQGGLNILESMQYFLPILNEKKNNLENFWNKYKSDLKSGLNVIGQGDVKKAMTKYLKKELSIGKKAKKPKQQKTNQYNSQATSSIKALPKYTSK